MIFSRSAIIVRPVLFILTFLVSHYSVVSYVIVLSMETYKFRVKQLCASLIKDKNIQFPIFLQAENLTESITNAGNYRGNLIYDEQVIRKEMNVLLSRLSGRRLR